MDTPGPRRHIENKVENSVGPVLSLLVESLLTPHKENHTSRKVERVTVY